MNDKKKFGEFITQKRKLAGLTQKNFAEKIFVTESAVSKWERGLSFPDITLIKDICETLGVNEHELLTASEDLEHRNTERIARRYVRIIEGYKKVLAVLYGLSLVSCLICNIAISHTLSWFFLVLTSELVAFSLTLLPIFVKKNRGIITLAVFFTSTILLLLTCNLYTQGDWFWLVSTSFLFGMTVVFLPFILDQIEISTFLSRNKAFVCFCVDTLLLFFLLFVCNQYTRGDWFLTKAVPITAFALIVPWSMMVLIRYTGMNVFLKTSACICVMALFQFFANGIISMIIEGKKFLPGFRFNFSQWNNDYVSENINMIVFFWLILMSLVFVIAGSVKSVRDSSETAKQDTKMEQENNLK